MSAAAQPKRAASAKKTGSRAKQGGKAGMKAASSSGTTRKKRARKKPGKKRVSVKPRLYIAALAVLGAAALALGGFYANRLMERRTYKLLYSGEIAACAEKYSVDPYLVAAVIQVESSNRPSVVSPKGAVGLMQIMPKTGEWIAGKIGMEGYSQDSLSEPGLNIELGCWYLSYLMERYGGIEQNAVAAYNAGQGNVDKWLSDERYGDGSRLNAIPFAETEKYVERVALAKEKYIELYGEKLG